MKKICFSCIIRDSGNDSDTASETSREPVQNPTYLMAKKHNTAPQPEPENNDKKKKSLGVSIEGFLMRHSREGKWKKRYYETVEEKGWWMLVYYKTPEREKILNAIKLHRTKKISMMPQDDDDAIFAIEMESGQTYLHRSASHAESQKWVDALGNCRLAALEKKNTQRPGRRDPSITIMTAPDTDNDDTQSLSIQNNVQHV